MTREGDDNTRQLQAHRKAVQKKTFTAWANSYLIDRILQINDLYADLEDGTLLCNLCEIISSKDVGKWKKITKTKFEKAENLSTVFTFLAKEGIKLVNMHSEDIFERNETLILGLIWTIILRYQVNRGGKQSGSAKNDLLEWVSSRTGEKVTAFRDLNDGRVLSKLVNHLGNLSGDGVLINNPNALSKDNAVANIDDAMTKAKDILKIPKIMDPEELASDAPDDMASMTMLAMYRSKEEELLKGRTWPLTEGDLAAISAPSADASKSIAYGVGVEKPLLHQLAPFTIETRDSKDNVVPAPPQDQPDPITVVVTRVSKGKVASSPAGNRRSTSDLLNAAKPVPVDVARQEDGTWLALYTPVDLGKYIVDVKLNNKPIAGSPFNVEVEAGIAAEKTRAYGPGLESAFATKPAEFFIETFDESGAIVPPPRDLSGDVVKVTITDKTNGEVNSVIKGTPEGIRQVIYTPKAPGIYKVAIEVSGTPIPESPFKVTVFPDADATQSSVKGPGLENAFVDVPADFVVDVRDSNGKVSPAPNDESLDPLKVTITHNGEPVHVTVAPKVSGARAISYTPKAPGEYKIEVTVAGKPVGSSPYLVQAVSQVDAGKSRAQGPGLTKGISGHPAEFTVEVNDPKGKLIPADPDAGEGPVSVKVVNSSDGDKVVPAKIVPLEDGKYAVVYEPTTPGKYVVNVNVGNKPVPHSAFTVPIRPDVAADQSIAFGPGLESGVAGASADFTVDVRNKDGHAVPAPKDSSLDPVKISVVDDKGKTVPHVITANPDGTRSVSYTPKESGQYKVEVHVGDELVPKAPFLVDVRPQADASKSSAQGPGLEKPTAHESADFTVTVRDPKGLIIPAPKDPKLDVVTVTVIHDETKEEVPSEISGNPDGTRAVSYFPSKVGPHTVHVDVGGKPIPNSPFHVNVRPDADASKSSAYGPGLEEAIAAHPADFTVDVRDKDNQVVPAPADASLDPVKISVVDDKGKAVPHTVSANPDGTRAVSYSPKEPGKYKVNVAVGNQPVPNSPFTVDVKPDADASKSSAHGPGLEKPVAHQSADFTVVVHDPKGATVPAPADPKLDVVTVTVTNDDTRAEVPAEISGNPDGTRAVSYFPSQAGPHTVHVNVAGKPVPGSPFHVNVRPDVNANKSSAAGPGLEHPVDHEPTEFTVKLADSEGHAVPYDAAEPNLTVKVIDPNGKQVPSTIKPDGHNNAVVEYEPLVIGEYVVHVHVAEEPLAKSPFKVPVASGVSTEYTTARGPGLEKPDTLHPAKFTVNVLDKNKKPRPAGVDNVQVDVEGPNGEKLPADVKDNGDGTYDVTYNPEKPGVYVIDIAVNDDDIAQSPVRVEVKNVADPDHSKVTGPGLISAIEGQPAPFSILLFGKSGLPVPKDDDSTVSISVTGPKGEPVESAVARDENGVFQAVFHPETFGDHKVHVSVNDKPVKKSPLPVKVKKAARVSMVVNGFKLDDLQVRAKHGHGTEIKHKLPNGRWLKVKFAVEREEDGELSSDDEEAGEAEL